MNTDTNLFNNTRVTKLIALFIIIVSLYFLAKFINEVKQGQYIGAGVAASNTIQVTGTGDVFAIPNIANITVTVTADGKTVKEAQDSATTKNNQSMDILKSNGVDTKDIQTVGYNSSPKYETNSTVCTQYGCPPSQSKIVGYTVTQTNSVKVRDTNAVGKILADLGNVSGVQVSGPDFTIDNDTAVKAEARTKAIDDAKAKADELAKELGVHLVRIVAFSESGNYPIYYAKTMSAMDSAGAAAPTPEISAGQNKISSNVTITYEIR